MVAWRAGSNGEPGGRVAKAGEEHTAVVGDRSGALSGSSGGIRLLDLVSATLLPYPMRSPVHPPGTRGLNLPVCMEFRPPLFVD